MNLQLFLEFVGSLNLPYKLIPGFDLYLLLKFAPINDFKGYAFGAGVFPSKPNINKYNT